MRNRRSSSPARSARGAPDAPAFAARRDAGPWYREPWPWLVMLGPLVVVLASAVTVWLAVRSDDGVVAGDYYKRGLLVNQRLPKVYVPPVKVTTEIAFAGDELVVRPHGQAPAADALRATLLHPGTGTRQEVMLMRDGDGVYAGVAPPGPAGAWTVSFAASQLPTTVVSRP